jgi:hypothetical protein
MHIIENHQWGTSVPDDMEQAHTKMTGQADNEHLDISFICHLFSFLFEMRRRMFTMGMLQISTMNYTWLRLAARCFPNTYKNSMIPTRFPIHFTPRASINKRSRYQLK